MMNSPRNHSVDVLPSPTTAPAPPPPAPTILVYPTVSPETVIIPIISSIIVFPAAALTVICCLRYRAKRARRRAKQPRLGDRTDKAVPVIRIDGSRKPESAKGTKSKKNDSRHTNELHYTSATVFQAVLGIDLDLDERSEWENEVMGYTSVRGMSSPTSSMGSLQACPSQNSVQPRIIQMEMSPRAARSARTSPGRCDPLPAHVAAVSDIWRRPLEPLQRNGRPPGMTVESELQRVTEVGPVVMEVVGRQRNGHGPHEPPAKRPTEGQTPPADIRVTKPSDSTHHVSRSSESSEPSPSREQTPSQEEQTSFQEEEKREEKWEKEERQDEKEEDPRSESEDFWREPLRFIDDSSEAS